MSISTIIPAYKNKEMLLRNLKRNYPFLKGTQIIIVDDGSGEGIKNDIGKLYPDIICITNDKNLGFGGAVNSGFTKAMGDYILLLNNDVVLRDDSYKKALRYFKKGSKLFAVSFMQVERGGKSVGKNTIYFKDGFYQHEKGDIKTEGLNGWAEGGSMMMRADYFRQLGGFSDLYLPFYFEDNDLSYRAYKKGWHVLFTPSILVEHHHESTIGKYFSREYITTIALRNQIVFFWGNIDDLGMWVTHKYKLGIFLISSLLKMDLWVIKAFYLALLRLPKVMRHRIKRGPSKRNDREIFLLFTHIS